jgi:hypothetical protein
VLYVALTGYTTHVPFEPSLVRYCVQCIVAKTTYRFTHSVLHSCKECCGGEKKILDVALEMKVAGRVVGCPRRHRLRDVVMSVDGGVIRRVSDEITFRWNVCRIILEATSNTHHYCATVVELSNM